MIAENKMDAYPVLDFIVRHGRRLALGLAAATFAAGVAAAWLQDAWLWSLAGAVGGVLVYGLAASYAELVRLVTDMLLPK